ncbi:hypothetical protein [Leptonema illini]|uniref:hypothetical protein n=1 Tax=Leptonema illini TaxID=183 RepID=UPI000595390E|nr:hypothetical protein [Leptonema illini]
MKRLIPSAKTLSKLSQKRLLLPFFERSFQGKAEKLMPLQAAPRAQGKVNHRSEPYTMSLLVDRIFAAIAYGRIP